MKNEQIQVNVQITEAAKNMTTKQVADAIAAKFEPIYPMFYGATVKKRGDCYVVSPFDLGDGFNQTIRVSNSSFGAVITVHRGKKELAMINLSNGIGYCNSGKMLFSLALEAVSDFKSTAKTAVDFAHALHDNISDCIDVYHLTGDGFEMHSNHWVDEKIVNLKLHFKEFVFSGRGLCSFEVGSNDHFYSSVGNGFGDVGYVMHGTYIYGSDNVFEQFKAWNTINGDIQHAIGLIEY